MKAALKLVILVVVLVLALTTCVLDQISVEWEVVSWTQSAVSTLTTITYDIWNYGKYDLEGVNLTFSVHSASGYLYVKSPNFDLAQGDYIANNLIVVNVAPDLANTVDIVEVVGVDMDKPSGY